jgi:hypothetical protein
MYSPPLLEYLHQVTPSPAKMPPAKKNIIEVEASDEFVFNEVQEEETKDEKWITKGRKDRDRRTDARERTRARLTKAKKQVPTPTKDYSPFESDDEDNKEEKVDENVGTLEEILVVLEDDVLSRLEIQELEYLQEQEETKSAILGNDMNSTMEEMMEKKLTERFDLMESDWEHKASNDAIKISEQVDRMTQLERKVSTQAEEVFKVIREATTTLTTTLEIKLTLAQDRTIEVDQAAEAMADFIDALTVANNEYVQNARTIMKQAKQKLYDTRNTLMAEMVSAPNTTTGVCLY